MEKKCITLKDGHKIPFVASSEKYGRAEFEICPVWNDGQLVELYIYPAQQEDVSYFLKWSGSDILHFTLSSYRINDDPKVWMFAYCDLHKCQTMRVYAPRGSEYLWFSEQFDSLIIGFMGPQNKIYMGDFRDSCK